MDNSNRDGYPLQGENMQINLHRRLVAVSIVHAYPASLLVRYVFCVCLGGVLLRPRIEYIPLGVN